VEETELNKYKGGAAWRLLFSLEKHIIYSMPATRKLEILDSLIPVNY